MITAKEFVEKAIKYEKLKTTYVWGTFGWPVTEANIERACKQYPSMNNKRKATMQSLLDGDVWMFDCVGYIKALLWGFNGSGGSYGGGTYASGGVPDIDADTMINRCSGVSTDFSNIVPGEVVWKSGHIGIYIGDRKVVECTPAWENGVQITACGNLGKVSSLNTTTWTKHGKLPYVKYKAAEKSAVDITVDNMIADKVTTEDNRAYWTAVLNGDKTVNVQWLKKILDNYHIVK